MQIAVLSGKGGTGKTLVSVNLAYIENNSQYVDCDVEEPNGLLYFKLPNKQSKEVNIKIPKVDHDKCIGCQKCSDFCKFNALAYILDKVRVFKELCHSCGGCKIVCPVEAISEVDKTVGFIHEGYFKNTKILSGEMIVGVESGVPIISEMLKKAKQFDGNTFIDSPPGNGCSVMESIKDSDYCLLIAEPTIFGKHNLNMVYQLARTFNKKMGIVINKDFEDTIIDEYASVNNIPIIGRIPMDLELGKLNSDGQIISSMQQYRILFQEILDMIYKEVNL